MGGIKRLLEELKGDPREDILNKAKEVITDNVAFSLDYMYSSPEADYFYGTLNDKTLANISELPKRVVDQFQDFMEEEDIEYLMDEFVCLVSKPDGCYLVTLDNADLDSSELNNLYKVLR